MSNPGIPPRPNSLTELPYRPNRLDLPARSTSLSVIPQNEALKESNPVRASDGSEKNFSRPSLASQPSFSRLSRANLLKTIGKASSVVAPTLSTMISPAGYTEDGKPSTAPITLKFINSRAHLEPLYQHFFNVTYAKSLRFFLIFPMVVIGLYIGIDYLFYFSTMKYTAICRVLTELLLGSVIAIAHFFPNKISYVIPFCVYIGLILLAWVDLIWGTYGYEPILQIVLWGGYNIPGGVTFYNLIMGVFFIPTHAILYIVYGKQSVSQVLLYQSLTFAVYLIGSNNLKMESRHREIFLSLHDIVVAIKSKALIMNPPKISVVVNDTPIGDNEDNKTANNVPVINTVSIAASSSPRSLSFRELTAGSPGWRSQTEATNNANELEEFSTNAKVEFSGGGNHNTTNNTENKSGAVANNTNNGNLSANNSNSPPPTTPSSIHFHPTPLGTLPHLNLDKTNSTNNLQIVEEDKEPTLEEIMRVHKAMNLFLSLQRNKWTCNFHRDSLEKEYRRFYTNIADQGLLLFFTFTVGSFCLFVIHDLNFIQSNWLDLAIGLRFGVIVPCSLSILTTVLIKRFRVYRIQLVTLVVIILGCVYCVMLYFSKPALSAFNIYYGSIMRVMSYGVSGLLLPFTYSSFSSVLITIIYFVVMVLKGQSAISIILVMLWGPSLSRQYDSVLRMKFILQRRPEMLREYIATLLSSENMTLDKNSQSLKDSLLKWEQEEEKSDEKVANA
eukprot:TRINITY_DN7065_c0_g1_i1.p1 TRINITY_DN7065_c0_g1~~TRINITY_DN7065_c0_g1_i1.p1  ORF type:complete len:728 (-),score=125.72 TRINITY_DN7065_c0_g1_i1:25-2208(-)